MGFRRSRPRGEQPADSNRLGWRGDSDRCKPAPAAKRVPLPSRCDLSTSAAASARRAGATLDPAGPPAPACLCAGIPQCRADRGLVPVLWQQSSEDRRRWGGDSDAMQVPLTALIAVKCRCCGSRAARTAAPSAGRAGARRGSDPAARANEYADAATADALTRREAGVPGPASRRPGPRGRAGLLCAAAWAAAADCPLSCPRLAKSWSRGWRRRLALVRVSRATEPLRALRLPPSPSQPQARSRRGRGRGS